MAKRILIFSLAYYPSHVSGAEVAIKEITDRIDPKEIEFAMVTHRFLKSTPCVERIGHVTVHRVGFGPSYVSKILFVPLAAWKAASLHRMQHFDAAWVMMTYMLFPLVFARALGARMPYLFTLQDGDPYEKVFERWFIRPVAPILDWGIRHAKMIQAISSYLATWPQKRGYSGEVHIVPNGASEFPKEFSQHEFSGLARSLRKRDGDVLLLTIARLEKQKAVDVVIRALALLPEHIKLVIVGDGSEREALEELAGSTGVSDRVRFKGRVDRSVTAMYRQACDIFVLPSRSEGQSISLVSSMRAGIPVVATQEGGIADFLFDAERNPDKEPTGWAVDADNPQQIADVVSDILAHPEEVRRTIERAKRLAIEKYDWNAIVVDMRHVFDTLCA